MSPEAVQPLSRLAAGQSDVLIVGAGALGCALAARFAEAGKSVVLLEAGPMHRASDLFSSQIWARRLKWGGSPVTEGGSEPIGYAFNAGYGVGGSALHHYAVWPRLHPEDFEMRTRYGRGLDWPLTYAELAPYYDAVQAEAGIAGDAQQERWRPPGAPYPMPGVPLFAQGRLIARGFARLGKAVAPLPLAVTSVSYRGRPVCLWDGWCDAGCPIGALANPLTLHLPRALAAGATLLPDTPAVRIITNARGDRALGVEVASQGGSRRELRAQVIVLAAFAIENPRLLLASASPAHPAGLGNAHGLVGRYVMTHTAGSAYALFNEPTEPHFGASGGQLLNQDGYPKGTHARTGAFGSYQWMIAQAVKPNDLLGIAGSRPELYGAALDEFLHRAARSFAGMTAVIEDLPAAENRVSLQRALDRHNVPRARVVHDRNPATVALWRAAMQEGEAVLKAAGAQEVWTWAPGTMHLMGGTIMGRSDRDSVVNSYGQMHAIPNLLLAGPGVFPTSGGVNPTFTAYALAARSSEYLLANWTGIAA